METKIINGNWIKLYREILDKPIWLTSTPEQKTILITLLLMANHAENEWEFKGEKFVCKPGQFITSLERIAEKSGKGISIQNVRTALIRFEKYEFLTNKSTNRNRLITICNWSVYQVGENELNKGTNKRLTNDQHVVNNQLTTNKNDKNNKNENKSIYDFDSFWNDYDKKVDKKKVKHIWSKISETDRKKIKKHIPLYKTSQPYKQYRKNPQTYLNNESWNDEILITGNDNQIKNNVYDY